MGDFFASLLFPIEWFVAWVMVTAHAGLTAIGFASDGGPAWTLSIIAVVLVVRTLLIPLFVRQIKASRAMQIIQPELKKIQDKYKGRSDQASREAMTKETMELYRSSKTNPFASCLPILVQLPIFFGLFRVLNRLRTGGEIGPFNDALIAEAQQARFFGAPLSDTMLTATSPWTYVVAPVLVVIMTVSQFYVQRMLMTKNMSPAAMDSPFFKQQKMLLYVLPLVFAVSGVGFAIGLVLYWCTTNIYSAVQQTIVIRSLPAPGSPAEKELEARRRRKAERKAARTGKSVEEILGLPEPVEDAEPAAPAKRVQPRKQPRSKRKPGAA
ncbi:membrane protein insertase YidC [Aquipuribacter nitratireducens]|uniref:Membrane protein insertase YidC n=1 Tax=Aquipuribacter nitratireducens TaxID=650104 RepID=A0ABW0GP80_9MICO